MGNKLMPERNAAVLADFAQGLTYADLSRKYGISVERIRQIVFKGVRVQRFRDPDGIRYYPQDYTPDGLRATLNRPSEESV